VFLHGASRGPIGIVLVVAMIAVRLLLRGGMGGFGGRGGMGRGPFGRRRGGPFI
jgi:hypothetical protein